MLAVAMRTLDDWFETALGRYLWTRERAVLRERLKQSFGHHGLEIGVPEGAPGILDAAAIPHRLRLGCGDDPDRLDGAFVGHLDSLCLQPRTLTAVVLVHVLEFHVAPGRALAAVEQALIPGGLLLAAVFNPASLWGLRRRLTRDGGPWRFATISPRRCRDWLKALQLEPDTIAYLGHRPPLDGARGLAHWRWLDRLGPRWPGGGAFVIGARKTEYGGQNIHYPARARRRLARSGKPQPAPRAAGKV